MTSKHKRGFTLIELMVVVLIIGILAAVAAPQYQVAVLKSRFAEAAVNAEAIRRASQRYYMANGSYAVDLRDLDIGINCKSFSADGNRCVGRRVVCYTSDSSNADGSRAPTAYCNLGDILIYLASPLANLRRCVAAKKSAPAQQVCKSMGGVLESQTQSNNYYRLP